MPGRGEITQRLRGQRARPQQVREDKEGRTSQKGATPAVLSGLGCGIQPGLWFNCLSGQVGGGQALSGEAGSGTNTALWES